MKKFSTGFLAGILVTSSISVIAASGRTIQVFDSVKQIVVDKEQKPFSKKDTPFVYDNTTYVPLRFVAEALNKPVTWDSKTGTVFIGEVIDVKPVVEQRELTKEEISEVNKAFDLFMPVDIEGYPYDSIVNPAICFFSCTYDNPKNMEFERFIDYFCSPDTIIQPKITEAEFEEIKKTGKLIIESNETLQTSPVGPHIKRVPVSAVNKVLDQFMGITVDDLDTTKALYLGAPYNAYYITTSDAPDMNFKCIKGKIDGDTVILDGNNGRVTLKNVNGKYRIVSYKQI